MSIDYQLAIDWAIQTCEDPDVGYAGGTNPGAVPASWRDMSLHDGKRYCDCSSFIWYALLAAGFNLTQVYGNWPFTTYTMGNVLIWVGFTRYNSADVAWQQGDILVFPGDPDQGTGHTEMSYDGHYLMGAHRHDPAHLTFEQEVSISDYESSAASYPYLYRWTDNPPQPARKIPIWLLKKGIEKGGIY